MQPMTEAATKPEPNLQQAVPLSPTVIASVLRVSLMCPKKPNMTLTVSFSQTAPAR